MRFLPLCLMATIFALPVPATAQQANKKATKRVAELERMLKNLQDVLVVREQKLEKATAALQASEERELANQIRLKSLEQKLDDLQRARALEKKSAEKQGAEHAYTQALKSQINAQLMKMQHELAELQQRVGPGHPAVKTLRERLVQTQKWNAGMKLPPANMNSQNTLIQALEVRLAATRENFGAGHPKVKSLEQQLEAAKKLIKAEMSKTDKALVQAAIESGEKMSALLPLLVELRHAGETYGPEHPQAKALQEAVSAWLADVKQTTEKSALEKLKRHIGELTRIRNALSEKKGEQTIRLDKQLDDAQRELEAKLKFAHEAAQGQIKDLMSQRTKELMEMEKRLVAAEKLRQKSAGNADDNVQRIEARLEKIEATLKKVIEKLEDQ